MTALGICGAHRTGKTTLAKAVAKALNMPFVEIGTSNIFRERGLDPAKPMDSRTRLLVQQTILRCACNIWDGMDEAFICDRTPIDMAAYMLADVGNGELDQCTQDEIMSYLGECFRVAKRYFGKIVLVPPAIPFIPAQHKAAINEPLIFKLHYGISGMLSALGMGYRKLPNDCLEIGDRVEFVEKFWRENS